MDLSLIPLGSKMLFHCRIKGLVRIKHNRILRDLFRKESQVHKSVNRYRRDYLITFAKGFTATGVTAFLLIVFGV